MIAILENEHTTSMETIRSFIVDVKEHASLLCLSITESLDMLLEDENYLNDFEIESIKSRIYTY